MKKKKSVLRHKLISTIKKRPQHIRWALAMYGVLVVSLIIGLQGHVPADDSPATPQNPFSLTQRSAVPFTLYYPAKLPPNLPSVQPVSAQVQNGTVTLTVSGTESRSATLSQQAVLTGFDHDTFRRGLTDSRSVDVPLGTVVAGTADNGQTHVCSLITKDGTWLLVTASSNVPIDDLIAILRDLRASAR
jgi:hypothetical protein